jgi:hypothetical protein
MKNQRKITAYNDKSPTAMARDLKFGSMLLTGHTECRLYYITIPLPPVNTLLPARGLFMACEKEETEQNIDNHPFRCAGNGIYTS